MINHYNFTKGGLLNQPDNPPKYKDPILKGRHPKADFYQRILQGKDRQTIPDNRNKRTK